ncbi:TPA: DEAD/DEAH box helicase [Pasteurella multocida]|nr:DEAD/DEAH box helicase [Pasteurella multocida]
MLTTYEIENKLKSKDKLSQDDSFLILQSICALVNSVKDDEKNKIQQLLLRVLDRKDEFVHLAEIINDLIRHFGLYPYLDTDLLTIKDAIARELHKPALLNNQTIPELNDEGIVFHRLQAEVYQYLMNGENVILSAPTSFGKSALIDSLIESNKFNNIIIVVPTIALIDETRRRLFVLHSGHKIITHASQELRDRNIFILTQERAVEFPYLPEFDLFILDEFYKLDPREDSDRAMVLNHAFYKLYKRSKQFYLLGPNIQNIPEGLPERFNCKFIKTDYSTVVTDLITVKTKDDTYQDLIELCNKIQGSTLIFCSSPKKARVITQLLVDNYSQHDVGLPEAAEWIAQKYHPEWTLVKGLRNGIGMHHGRIPRAIAHICVKGFNEEKLPFLVCTSTLIEGVNTKAKNIIIFDNKIASKKYDFFTFNNIRGRSGRMFQHFIGHVYLFNEPPQETLPIVDIPVFSQDENTNESLLIQLDAEDINSESWERVKKYHEQDIISLDVLRSNSGIEPNIQLNLANHLLNNPNILSEISWNNYPEYQQLLKLCSLIWDFLIEGNQFYHIKSGRQLAFKINQLRNCSIEEIIEAEINNTRYPKTPDDAVENTLNFVRQWAQFYFPRFAMAVCRIQNAIADKLGIEKADYSFFCGQVENLFLDPALVALDEYGMPLALAQKLEEKIDSKGSLDLAIKNLSTLNIEDLQLSYFEKEILGDVIKSI